MTIETRSGDFIQSLERGLAVIGSFSGERRRQTLSEVAATTGLTRATARRVLLTLTELGYVDQSGRVFSLAPKVLDLGYAYLSSQPMVELAQRPMERLVDEVNESSSMSVLDGTEIVYVARVPTRRIMTISLAVGSRLPAYPTAMGRVLLAGLSDEEVDEHIGRIHLEPLTESTITDPRRLRDAIREVRGQGWALVDQELEVGVRSIAAPISVGSGTVRAAINVSGHATRVSVERLREDFLPLLLATAATISVGVGSLPRS